MSAFLWSRPARCTDDLQLRHGAFKPFGRHACSELPRRCVIKLWRGRHSGQGWGSCTARKSTSTGRSSGTAKKLKAHSDRYTYRTSQGFRVISTVEKQWNKYVVTITVPGKEGAKNGAALVWGLFRSTPAKWFNPGEVSPQGSTQSRTGRGQRTELWHSDSGSLELQLQIPEKLAPVFLAFQLEINNADGEPVHHGPARGPQHFAVPIGLSKGNPLKYGASVSSMAEDGQSVSLNFAVVSRNATAVSLAIARRSHDGGSSGYLEIALDPLVNRAGDVWHVRLDGLKDLGSLCWGWRADADISWDMGNRFHPGQIMLDPYSPIATPVWLPEGVNVPPPKKGLASDRTAESNPPALLGCLSFLLDNFDWEGARRPNTALEDTFILEVDIPSFSGGTESSIPHDHRGKFQGILAALPDIRASGATAVMLTPVALGGAGMGPFNRAPYSFFAPEVDFASGSEAGAAAAELRSLVKGLHAAGVEVYLQVEYCLTGEGWDEDASAISLRGLDAAVYYRAKGVLNCGHANVRALILDSLRHWARYYQVDGFCFLNAETLTLDREGTVLDNPPLAEEIANDPHLRQLKLIAWAADDSLLPRGGQRGFPHWATWLERNKRFSTDFHSFFTAHGASDIASSIATRICGSPDLFSADWGKEFPGGLATGRRAAFGLNSASYLDKSDISATVASILPEHAAFGQDQTLARSLLFASIMSQGTPVFGADVLLDSDLAKLVAGLWQLRQKLAAVLRPITFDNDWRVTWMGAEPGRQPDWTGDLAASGVPGAAYLAYSVVGADGRGVYIAYNPYEGPVPAILPQPPMGSLWKRAVDTSDSNQTVLPEERWIPLSAPDYTVSAKGALLLVATPQSRAPAAARPTAQASGQDSWMSSY